MADIVEDVVIKHITALNFASYAHDGQRRKYTDDPYTVHPIMVARLTNMADGATEAMIDAALLHDVVEDTDATIDDILDVFGYETADLVRWLTDELTPADGNRAERKQSYAIRFGDAPAAAQTIKLADMIDNTNSICVHDPKFAPSYLAEKRFMLGFLTKGDARLMTLAKRTLDAWSTYYGVK